MIIDIIVILKIVINCFIQYITDVFTICNMFRIRTSYVIIWKPYIPLDKFNIVDELII